MTGTAGNLSMFRSFHRNLPFSTRGRFDEALHIFHSLPGHYLGGQWTLLRGHMLLNELKAHLLAKKAQDELRSRSAIELLACSVLVGRDQDAFDILIPLEPDVLSPDFDDLHPIHHLLGELSASQCVQRPSGEQINIPPSAVCST